MKSIEGRVQLSGTLDKVLCRHERDWILFILPGYAQVFAPLVLYSNDGSIVSRTGMKIIDSRSNAVPKL